MTHNFLARHRLRGGHIGAVCPVFVAVVFPVGGQQVPNKFSVLPYGVLFTTGLILVRGHTQIELAQEGTEVLFPRVAKRQPESCAGRVYRLTVRDQSVEVVTSEGTITIRSRFTHAIAEMKLVSGHCARRSHWVADDTIVGVERKGGTTFLRLQNNDLVLVSRKYKPMLEQDGIVWRALPWHRYDPRLGACQDRQGLIVQQRVQHLIGASHPTSISAIGWQDQPCMIH